MLSECLALFLEVHFVLPLFLRCLCPQRQRVHNLSLSDHPVVQPYSSVRAKVGTHLKLQARLSQETKHQR